MWLLQGTRGFERIAAKETHTTAEQEIITKQDVKRLEERMDQMQNQVIDAPKLLQKEILRGFNNWISPMEIRLRGQEERLSLLEERLRQIERALSDDSAPSEIN